MCLINNRDIGVRQMSRKQWLHPNRHERHLVNICWHHLSSTLTVRAGIDIFGSHMSSQGFWDNGEKYGKLQILPDCGIPRKSAGTHMFLAHDVVSANFPLQNKRITHSCLTCLQKYSQAIWENVIRISMNYGPTFILYTLCIVRPGAVLTSSSSCSIK